jgi:hypothetical protein
MTQFTGCGQSEVSSVARGVLRAFARGEADGHKLALAQAEQAENSARRGDSREAEQLDVLRSALEALEGPAPERIQAGMYLLKHLAAGAPAVLANTYTA